MIIIVDVNILLSALIKDSMTREILISSELDFCFPEKSMQKIRKYRGLIQEKSGLSDLEFLKLFHYIMKFIRIIPDEELLFNWDEAKAIMEQIDPEDVTFIAAALSQEDAIIWSDDAHFDKQDSIKVLKTKDMIRLFNNSL